MGSFALAVAAVAHGQTPALLSDLGASPPFPGVFDITQLSTVGNVPSPDGLNYYTDNQASQDAGEPGQTFVTGTNAAGYLLDSLALETGGLNSFDNIDVLQPYLLHIYSVSGGNATPLASFISPNISFDDGDWLQWSGLGLTLPANGTYAYSFGRTTSGTGWEALAVASGQLYSGGEIGLFQPSGGPITFGSSHSFDAVFDLGPGLPAPALVINAPAASIDGTSVKLSGQVLSSGAGTPSITIYYGPVDGGTNAGDWAASVSLGPQAGAFSGMVNGLTTNTTYYFAAMAVNSAGTSWALPAQSFTTLVSNIVLRAVTYHYDNTRQGANTNETILTPANVNVQSFGKLCSYNVDGYVFAQPLYMQNVAIPGMGVHNVVFVATEHDSVYAFDADGNLGQTGGLLWQTNLGVYALSSSGDFGTRYHNGLYEDLVPDVGITGTPVIDPATGTLYVDAFTHEGSGYVHRIHALNITNGTEQPYSPIVVAACAPGTGFGSTNGMVSFTAVSQNERSALTLAGGLLYVDYGSYSDTDPFHGWVMGYNPATLRQLTNYVFNTTPNASFDVWGNNAGEGGVWLGGNGLGVDAATNLFLSTGNGSFDAYQSPNGGDYAETFIRLSTSNGLAVADWFAPYNGPALGSSDQDLSSGGVMLLPDSVGSVAHPHLLVGAGKGGTIYLLDRDNLGQYDAHHNDSQIVQELPDAIGGVWSSPAYFNNWIYYHGDGDLLKAFSITNAVMSATPVSEGTFYTGNSGATSTPVVSANGSGDAIVWEVQCDAASISGPAVLRAYNATNLLQELYDSSQDFSRDNPGAAVKYSTPLVINGKVYVGAEYGLSVYGNGSMLTNPVIAPNGGDFTNSVTVTLSDASSNASLYYTLDNSMPTTNSTPYTAPFVLTNSAMVQVLAVQPGAINSGIVSAEFLDTSGSGNGVGLQGSYWSSTSSEQFTNSDFDTNSPTLVRTDATIDFQWDSDAPDPSIYPTNYAVEWTGTVQPQYGETYTFYTTTEDGVRLWVNGQLLIDEWVDELPTTWSGSITLRAQQFYNIRMDYYESEGLAEAELAWSSPSTPEAIIPQSQLYPFTNPPPAVALTAPTNNATATPSVTLSANAAGQYNSIDYVSFYTNGALLGCISNAPYTLTATGLAPGSYALTAVAADTTGLAATSAPVNVTIQAGSGLPYGLTTRGTSPPFYNMPGSFIAPGSQPPLLSETGVFTNTPNMSPAPGLIPYSPNTPLWSDNAVKTRYLSVPYSGGLAIPNQQISYAPTGQWAFPSGTVFVKTFAMTVNETNANVPLQRLETRLLVRDTNGAVYGVTYKWRPDNSDADLLTTSSNETLYITNTYGVRTQTWYYPSPTDCLTCHTPVANYVLGLNTRQLNGPLTYTNTGVTDNQLRTLNELGVLNPAIDEFTISNLEQMVSVTNASAALQNRFKSYIDANCSQCHQPGGTGPSFDARYETPLTNEDIIGGSVVSSLGVDNAHVVTPEDVWRSMLYQRVGNVATAIKMPPLARNVIDTNAVTEIGAWIDSLPGTPALAPPTLSPAGATFSGLLDVTVIPPDNNSAIYYTLDGSLPTTNSLLYTGPIVLTNSMEVSAVAVETNYNNSVAASDEFTSVPVTLSAAAGAYYNGVFQMQLTCAVGGTYVLEASADLINWTPIATNVPVSVPFQVVDPGANSYQSRFYRVVVLP